MFKTEYFPWKLKFYLIFMENIQKFFREIAFLSVLKCFLIQKLIFGHFWNSKKWILATLKIVKTDAENN